MFCCLDGGYDYDLTAIPFDSHSTAVRRRYDRSTNLRNDQAAAIQTRIKLQPSVDHTSRCTRHSSCVNTMSLLLSHPRRWLLIRLDFDSKPFDDHSTAFDVELQLNGSGVEAECYRTNALIIVISLLYRGAPKSIP